MRRVSAFDSPATDLVAAMIAELVELYGARDRLDTPTATPEELSPPGGAFLVLEEPGGPPPEILAGGGIKRWDAQTAEIKRMYVVPDARGRGLARVLLAELEAAARGLGYTRVRLDTGPLQPHARALYESARYTEIEAYNANPYAAFWGEKAL